MRLAIVCTARPSYSKLRPVIQACIARGINPVIYATSGALLYRFGAVVDQMKAEFGAAVRPIYAEFDGYTLETAAKSSGALLSSLADVFSLNKPDLVLVNHDRREVLAAAQAAAYQNIPVAHIGGGERSGNIDDRVRDAITCLSTYHFTATERAAQRVEALLDGHNQYREVCNVGCPSIDLAKRALEAPPVTLEELGGAGLPVDLSQPFILVLQHACTDDPEASFRQMQTTLNAVKSTKLPTLVIWPGTDAGADGAAKAIRLHQEHCHTVRTVPPERFLRLLRQCSVLVGNSSAGIRESAFLGTPVVNVGDRQKGRERSPNVLDAEHDFAAIRSALHTQLARPGSYAPSYLYGRGDAAARIATAMAQVVAHV